eukprot:m.163215 g.163215  ORF g.163215 m.163215 type:complete len:512 (+) comp9875_c0_seq5:113-1648(+)
MPPPPTWSPSWVWAAGLAGLVAAGTACVLSVILPSWAEYRLSRRVHNVRTGRVLANSHIKLPLGDILPEIQDVLAAARRRIALFAEGAVGFWMLGDFMVLLSNADWLRDLLSAPDRNYRRAFALRMMTRILGGTLIGSDGENWARLHKIMYRAFQPSALAAYVPLYARRARTLAARLAATADAGGREDMLPVFNDLALGIMVDAGFGAAVSADDYSVIYEGFRYVAGNLSNLLFEIPIVRSLPLPPIIRMDRQFASLHAAADRVIAARKAMHASGQYHEEHDGKYALDLLLDAHGDDGKLNDVELRDNVIMLLAAGSETTATGMTWTLWHICTRPAVLARVREELDGLTTSIEDLDASKLDVTLPYLTKVVSESLRLTPPIHGIAERIITEDTILGEISLPTGAKVRADCFTIHLNPVYWPRADEFDPERFSEEEASKRHRFAYFPFGLGRRQCMGRVFALNEIRVVIATLLRDFDFTYDEAAGPVRVALRPPSLVPAAGMPMRVHHRTRA